MTPMTNEQAVYAARMRRGADWFFWLAGLSFVSVVLSYFRASATPFFGLGIIDLFAGITGAGFGVAVGIDAVVIIMFCALGYFARTGNKPAYISGMVLYLLDAGICFLRKDYLAILGHAYVLYRLFTGFQAAQQYGKLAASQSASAFDRSNQPPQPGVWPPPPNN